MYTAQLHMNQAALIAQPQAQIKFSVIPKIKHSESKLELTKLLLPACLGTSLHLVVSTALKMFTVTYVNTLNQIPSLRLDPPHID